ncbi:MAG TPA: lipopolysaccharide transport periplasmic protein LptA [Desulfobulbaceae bacterium]|nr:lipopolysaccharide transport periplasmic protein LptA [Desulfobulbaceae bacterium]
MKTIPIKNIPAILPAILLLLSVAAFAADKASAPIHIEADRMISQEQKNSVVFLGNVDAKQGDLTIRCEEMTVYYTQDKSKKKTRGGSNEVKKLVCRKKVEITQGDWLGTGNRMDYLSKDRKVILSGNAKAWQGPNMVSGKTITYYLDEKRSIVEQDKKKSGRVTAVIHPESDAKK